jgi:Cd2+/Zn2+-exporting ATPase
MDKLTLLIEDMDCLNEVILIERELMPLVGDQSRLEFDLLARQLTVDLSGLSVDRKRIAKAVAATGMRVVEIEAGAAGAGNGMGTARVQAGALQGCTCCGGTCSTNGSDNGSRDSFWQRHGRTLLCAASGLLWLAGFAAAAIEQGSLLGALREDGSVPLAAAAPWLVASLAGMWPVLHNTLHSLRKFRPDMNLLMFIAVAGALALGDFSEGASVAFLFALANLVESWSMGRARRSIQALMDITPPTALVLEPLRHEPVVKRVENVQVGSLVLVRPGDRIPLDGVVRKGNSAADQSPITGESVPVPKEPGDEVFAGTINADGALEVQTIRPASDTTLARITHMVEAAQSRRAKAARWVEKFAAAYTPAMVGLSVLVAVLPPLVLDVWGNGSGGFARWFYQALVVLVISCPCALVISTPVAVAAALASAARNGVLVKGGAYLEAPASIAAVALDKTGTLTLGRPSITSATPSPGTTESYLLAVAAALESRSSHPLAQAIVSHAKSLAVTPPAVEDALAHPGRGAQGRIRGEQFFVGNERLLAEKAPHLWTQELSGQFERASSAGSATVIVWNESAVLGTLCVEDKIRPEAAGAVAELKHLGVRRIVMLTGDNEPTARSIAEQTGVTEFRAGLLPEDKTRFVAALVEGGVRTVMVGDGVNDAPALAAANLGVAMGSIGTDVAIETADVALMSDDLSKLPWLIRHSRRTLATIKANIAFALALKIVFLALVFLQMATLWSAIAADMGGSLIVIFNGLRLLRIRK